MMLQIAFLTCVGCLLAYTQYDKQMLRSLSETLPSVIVSDKVKGHAYWIFKPRCFCNVGEKFLCQASCKCAE